LAWSILERLADPMESAWQNLIVLVIVLAAGGYLCRMAWQSMARRHSSGRKSSACGGCSNCPSESASQDMMNDGPQVVGIGPLERSQETVSRDG
jgi:hypothetical protein